MASHSNWEIKFEPSVDDPTPIFVLERPFTEKINPLIFHLRTALDKLQFPPECKPQSIWLEKIVNAGFGFSESAIEYGLTVGLATQHTLVVSGTSKKDWPYISNCNNKDIWSCHFLPLTNCTKSVPRDMEPHDLTDGLSIISHHAIPQPFAAMMDAHANDEGEMEIEHLLWWRVQLMNYLIRPNSQTRQKVREMLQSLESEMQQVQAPCLVMHVRHGDIWAEPTRRRYFNLTEYMKAAHPVMSQIKSKVIFIATDDAAVLQETKRYPEYNFFWLPRERSAGKSSTMFKGHPDTELYWILVLLQLARRCNAFGGVFSSSFSNLIYRAMCAQNGCPVSFSMDIPSFSILY